MYKVSMLSLFSVASANSKMVYFLFRKCNHKCCKNQIIYNVFSN